MAITKVKSGVRTLGTGEVADANIAADAVITAKILDNNVTIAKIAGSASAAADTFLKKDGTWSEVASGTSWQSVKTGDFTAVAGEGYPCNTTAGALTATLPTSPTAGDTIEFFDYAGTFDTNRLLITPAGSDKIKGEGVSFEMIKERSGASLTYIDVTQGWIPTSGINEGTKAMAVPSYNVESLIIAGGGSGTNAVYNGGGGGGGTLYYGAETPKTPNGVALVLQLGSLYTVVIGTGGINTGSGTNGTDTTFSGFNIVSQTAVGGGKGDESSGGSGGGAGHGQTTGGTSTAGQGSNGGGGAYCAPGYPAGGGGGSGGAGNSNSGCSTPGAGGLGLNYEITGSSVNYSAGGGGGTMFISTYAAAGGDSAGAGNVDAPDGRGGGGGSGKNGGDGCVILRMLTSDYSSTSTGSPAVTTDGSYTILNFTASGTYTA